MVDELPTCIKDEDYSVKHTHTYIYIYIYIYIYNYICAKCSIQRTATVIVYSVGSFVLHVVLFVSLQRYIATTVFVFTGVSNAVS